MKVKKYSNGGWIEAKRKNSKSGSKESSIKSSTSNASNNSGKQVEKMKKIIQEEGRDARNLLFWTVPPTQECVPIKHDVSVYGRSKSETRIGCTSSQQLLVEASRGRTPRQELKINDQVKKPESKDIRARYWSYLFENLRRAIDKIFSTCEMDQSIDECQETLMMIEVYRHEFIELKKLLELKQEYDFDNNNGKNAMRGISWEVRKTSPGPRKHSVDGITEIKHSVLRSPKKTPRKSPRSNGNTWAAKVRGDSAGNSDVIQSEKPVPETENPIVPRLKLDEINEDLEDQLKTPDNVENGDNFDHWDERNVIVFQDGVREIFG